MKKLLENNFYALLAVGGLVLLGSALLKYVILFFGTLLICLVGFLIYELL